MIKKIQDFIKKIFFTDTEKLDIVRFFKEKNIFISADSVRFKENKIKIILPFESISQDNCDLYKKELQEIYPSFSIFIILEKQITPQEKHNHSHNHEAPVKKPVIGKHGDNKKIERKKIKHIIAIASGKGGVGKSTVCLNIARGLSKKGLSIGVIDADVHGPSIPIMTGGYQTPEYETGKLVPLERDGLKIMSIGFMVPQQNAIVWRGPLVSGAITQMFNEVEWGEIDIMVIDMPPGTGDAQLTLCKNVMPDGVVIVSTPQITAISDTQKSSQMFEQTNIKIMGVIENMSGFIAPDTGKEYFIFGKGGAKNFAEIYNYPFWGSLPIQMEIPYLTDKGKDLYNNEHTKEVSEKFDIFADNILEFLNNNKNKDLHG